MAVTNFPLIYQLEASRNCYSFSLSVQRVPGGTIVRSDISECLKPISIYIIGCVW